MGTPEFRNFQPDTPLRRFGTSSKSNISATSGFFSPFRPQARTSSLTDRLFGTPDNKQALQPWKASHDADSVSQGEGLTRVPPFGLGGMVGSPGPSCEDMFGAGGSTKDADAYIPSNGRFDEDGHADDGWNKEEGVGSEASTLGSSQLKFEFPIDTQTTEDVFGLGDFQEVFVTEEDLDKAREKLSEEEAKTPEQSISEILHTLQRWCVQDEKAENGKDSSDEEPVTIFADVVICYNFIELSCGLVRLHESRLSWHGILPSASQLMKNAGPIVAGKPTTISWSRALLTDIRFKNLSDGKPLLMFTVEETHFLQLCFKEGKRKPGSVRTSCSGWATLRSTVYPRAHQLLHKRQTQRQCDYPSRPRHQRHCRQRKVFIYCLSPPRCRHKRLPHDACGGMLLAYIGTAEACCRKAKPAPSQFPSYNHLQQAHHHHIHHQSDGPHPLKYQHPSGSLHNHIKKPTKHANAPSYNRVMKPSD
ncbi:uncharacterized protein EV422DRAFT_81866 [Fimicolochytrium jonesii]|uniref:uncharacterized protein n=1 Tax=Fimicolochytrium jonesii TaxID=1396493 RepID=UPI0022FE24F6|nr:uncharacterized protein EV422DRAFT_81866 [Fimicolochytrium jonesii]KAI8820181.1 hypothetical protein EV422DRAFT_81866 [Fimicolochytrium jonesii]